MSLSVDLDEVDRTLSDIKSPEGLSQRLRSTSKEEELADIKLAEKLADEYEKNGNKQPMFDVTNMLLGFVAFAGIIIAVSRALTAETPTVLK